MINLNKRQKYVLLNRHNWWCRRYNSRTEKVKAIQLRRAEDKNRGCFRSDDYIQQQHEEEQFYKMDAIEALLEVDAYDSMLNGEITIPQHLKV